MVFAIEDMERFDFAAGQFISMVAPRAGKTITRAYSLASAPRKNEFDLRRASAISNLEVIQRHFEVLATAHLARAA